MATVDRVGVVWQPPLTARTNSNIVSISIVQGRETREGKLKGRVIEHQAVQYRREIKEKGVNALTRAREDGGSDAEVCSFRAWYAVSPYRALTSCTEILRIFLPCLTSTFLLRHFGFGDAVTSESGSRNRRLGPSSASSSWDGLVCPARPRLEVHLWVVVMEVLCCCGGCR